MGLGDKIKNQADKLAGQAQEAFGKVTGNEKVEAEGEAKQAKAEAAQAAEAVKDKTAEVGHQVKDKANDLLNGDK